MNFNNHSDLANKHAFLSASSYHWLNYTPEKLETIYRNHRAKEEGTVLHAFAAMAVEKRIRLANMRKALNMFVNDAIGYKMQPEQVLYYSDNSFGTADAISFKDSLLRIHDLKTGVTKVSFKQLDIYCALFCLEYGVDPRTIQMEQRIYQGNGFEVNIPEPLYIRDVMNTIEEFDILLDNIKQTIR
jgi:hypothetical protein